MAGSQALFHDDSEASQSSQRSARLRRKKSDMFPSHDKGVGFCLVNHFRLVNNLARGRHWALPDPTYDPKAFLQTCLAHNGSIIPEVANVTVAWGCWAYFIYHLQVVHGWELKLTTGPKFFSGFVIFFTIFRIQAAYKRYLEGLGVVQTILDTIRAITSSIALYMDMKTPSSTPEEVAARVEVKVDMLRWSLLSILLMKVQSRLTHSAGSSIGIDFFRLLRLDLARCRGLLREDEYEEVEELIGIREWPTVRGWWCQEDEVSLPETSPQLPNWCINRLRSLVASQCISNQSKHGFIERLLNVFEGEMKTLQHCANKMFFTGSIHTPLAYVQMGRVLLLVFEAFFPMMIDPAEGLFANVFFPCVVALIFHGLDEICTDMEDPYGDDPGDIKLVTPLQDVEFELACLLEDNQDPALEKFAWRKVPAGDEWLAPRKVRKYLCLRSELVAAEALETSIRQQDFWSDAGPLHSQNFGRDEDSEDESVADTTPWCR